MVARNLTFHLSSSRTRFYSRKINSKEMTVIACSLDGETVVASPAKQCALLIVMLTTITEKKGESAGGEESPKELESVAALS